MSGGLKMQLSNKKITRIMKKYKKDFDDLSYYDETRIKRWGRKRIDITLNNKVIEKLKFLKEKKSKPISRIIEEAVENLN